MTYGCRIKVKFDFTFFAVLAFLIFIDKTGTAMLSLIACFLHEGGHLLAMAVCAAVPQRITFYGGGISVSRNLTDIGLVKRLIILSAGCFVNAVIALSCAVFLPDEPTAAVFSSVNILICVFNLIPVGYFDGAEIAGALLYRFFMPRTADIIKRITGVIMCTAIVAAIFVYCVICGRSLNISLGFALLYLIFAQLIS